MVQIDLCVACGNAIGGSTKRCPHCGQKWPHGRMNQMSAPAKVFFVIVIFIMIMLSGLCAG